MNPILFLMLATLALAQGCSRESKSPDAVAKNPPIATVSKNPSTERFDIALVPHTGDGKLDADLRHAQDQARTNRESLTALERLGWLFVAKARESFDPGYYKLAEQCALRIESSHPRAPEGLLLRGHVLQNLHRFKEAEPIARELVAGRGRAFDFGLLGDLLLEQGRLTEAIEAYQKMADLKPDLHAHARAAHVRWLKGDLAGAIEAIQEAVQSASPRDAESAAWVNSRLALYQFQAGDFIHAAQSIEAAIQFQPEYPPALLLRGRIYLAQHTADQALDAFHRAAARNPLPEYLWAQAEALRVMNRDDEAARLESRIKKSGAVADPRTLALYLATRGEETSRAVALAKAELENRADVHTYDALAWALAASGQWPEADAAMKQALAEGTQDARVLLHAGIIAAKSGRNSDAERFLAQAQTISQMLLPSENEALERTISQLQRGRALSALPQNPH
jgi:tetratricopeptide (TPR) repeat protein